MAAAGSRSGTCAASRAIRSYRKSNSERGRRPLAPPSALDVSLTALSGVGPKLAEAAAEAGIATLGDLLMRFPHSHRDRTIVPVAELEPGHSGTVRVEVLHNRRLCRRGLMITSVKVGDDSDSLPGLRGSTNLGSHRSFSRAQPSCLDGLARQTRFPRLGIRAPVRRPLGFAVFRPRREGNRETSLCSCPPGHRATEGVPDREAGRAGHRGAEPGRGAARCWSSARRGLATVADAVKAVHFPAGEEDVMGAGAARVRRALSLPSRCWPPASGHTAPSARRPVWASQASWSPDGSARCPSSRPPASLPHSTRSMPTSIPASRWRGC